MAPSVLFLCRPAVSSLQSRKLVGRELAWSGRHRAGPLVFEGEGCSKNLLCKYHGWAFNADGKLLYRIAPAPS